MLSSVSSKKVGYYLCIMICFLFPRAGEPAEKSLSTQVSMIQEAEDYLSIKPEHSWQLLLEMGDYNQLPHKQQLRFFLTKYRVARALKKTTEMEDALREVSRFQGHTFFDEKKVTILSSLGLFFRAKLKYQAAMASYLCALDYADKPRQHLSLINSIAVITRQLGQLDLSELIYRRAIPLADSLDLHTNSASLRNNLGTVLMDKEKFDRATDYFYQAFEISQNNLRRKSYLLNGLNLMFSSLMSGELSYFRRLDDPLRRLLVSHPEDDFSNAYYLWISALYKVKTSGIISEEEKKQLELSLQHVTNPKLNQLLVKHIAPLAGLKIEPKHELANTHLESLTIKEQEGWFELFPLCEWDKLRVVAPQDITEFLSPFFSIDNK